MRGMPRPWICSIAQADVQLYAPYQENDRDGAAACPATAAADPQANWSGRPRSRSRCARRNYRLTRISQEMRRASRRAHGGGEDRSLSQGALSAVPAGTAVHRQRKGTNNQRRNEHEDLIVAHQGRR